MSLDLYQNEIATNDLAVARNPAGPAEAGFWHNAIPGAAKMTMQGLASFAKGIDLLGFVGPIAADALTGTTERQDQYFKEHEGVFGRAVDYWTPGPEEVGTAGKIVGSVLPMLATFAISPTATLASQFGTQAEDFVKEGVPLGKAEAASALQTALLAAGMHLSNFGKTWAMKALVSGAGVNVAQGLAARAGTAQILEGTGQENRFKAWDAEAILIDAILGVGFGTIQHLGEKQPLVPITQSSIDAALALNQARHLETTFPGTPDPRSMGFHVSAMKQAIDDLVMDRPVNVEHLTVYHGSPHVFTEFDASKIGTGEGAQAFGHGLYLSETPEVATSYRPKSGAPIWAGKEVSAYTPDGAIEFADGTFGKVLDKEWGDFSKAMEAGPRAGILYKVAIPEQMVARMLDWDKPLSEQAPEVRAAMERYFGSDIIDDGTSKLHSIFGVWEAKDVTGERLYMEMQKRLGGRAAANMPDAAIQMREAGIPGIKYLDQASRGTGEGTRNYVVFPGEEGNLKITERNGQPVAERQATTEDIGIEQPIAQPIRQPVDMAAEATKAAAAADEWTIKRKAVEEQLAGKIDTAEAATRLQQIDALKTCLESGGMTSCLRRVTLVEEDQAAVLRKATELRGQGVSAIDAAKQAADAQRSDIVQRASGKETMAEWEAKNPKPGEAESDPVMAQAQQRAAEHPDLMVTERAEDGSVTIKSVTDMLKQADEEFRLAQSDESLFTVAATCLLGG